MIPARIQRRIQILLIRRSSDLRLLEDERRLPRFRERRGISCHLPREKVAGMNHIRKDRRVPLFPSGIRDLFSQILLSRELLARKKKRGCAPGRFPRAHVWLFAVQPAVEADVMDGRQGARRVVMG